MISPGQAMAPTAGLPRYVITDADRKRIADIEYARCAYEGELEAPLEPMEGEADDNIVDTIDEKVEAAVNFLFGKELEISTEEGIDPAAKEFLDSTWGEKEARIPLLQELGVNGMLCGQAFLRIQPQQGNTFRLVALDPATVYVQTMPGDCRTVLLYCIEYTQEELGSDGRPTTIYYREEITRLDPQADDPDSDNQFMDQDTTWEITHWTREGERSTWLAAGPPIPWRWPFPPIFSCPNLVRPNKFWGKAEVTRNLVKMVESLNTTMSTAQKLGRIMAGALIWAKGTGLTDDLTHEPGHIILLPSPDSEMGSVPLQLDFAGLNGLADRLQSRIDERTGVPGIATGRAAAMPGGNMSGIAIELLFMALIKRTDTKRCNYGKLILDVSKALLALAGFSPDIQLTLEWQNPLPNDDIASWQAAALEDQAGVSKQTILGERGYNAEEEMERKQAEDAMALVKYSRGQGLPPAPGQPPADQGQMVGMMAANSGQPGGSESPFIGRNL